MSHFVYRALKDRKQEVKGQIEAASRSEAVSKLRGMGLFTLSIQEGEMRNDSVIERVKVAFKMMLPDNWLLPKKSDVVQSYRQLSLMLSSGHALMESLELTASLAKRRKLSQALLDIKANIQKGDSFGQALAKFPKIFSLQVVELVKSAEVSGELDSVLLRLADDTERLLEMKRNLMTALIYPVIIVVMAIGLMVLLAVWVLPKLVAFVDGKDVEMPKSTEYLITISNFITYDGHFLAAGIGLTIFSILAAYTTASGKRVIDRILLRVPLVGPSIICGTMAQSGWTLSMLSASGVTLLDSLRVCARVTSNEPLKQGFNNASEEILKGVPLSKALHQKFVPELFYKMAAIGEKSGELDRVMSEIGSYFNQELQARLKRMLAMIEPALMLMIGLPVGFVYLSIFKLIFAVSTGGR